MPGTFLAFRTASTKRPCPWSGACRQSRIDLCEPGVTPGTAERLPTAAVCVQARYSERVTGPIPG